MSRSLGAQVSRQYYYPYGGVRYSSAPLPTDYGFTGQTTDDNGLINMGARVYSPALGRFLSPDSIVPGAGNPQALNRYSFVLGNPIKYTDPSGHDPCDAGGAEGNEVLLGCGGAAPGATPSSQGEGDSPSAASQDGGPGLQSPVTTDPVTEAQNAAEAQVQDSKQSLNETTGQCSFSGDTLVATDSGEVPIDHIFPGDRVLAFNQQLGETGYYTVTATWAHTDRAIVSLWLGDEQIETTLEHPFLTAERGWTAASSLWAGAHVRRSNGNYGQVVAITTNLQSQVMYNLTVAQAHTFFVGLGQWLVHNTCPSPNGQKAYPRGQGASQGPIPDGYVPVSRWVDGKEVKLWMASDGTTIPAGVGTQYNGVQRVYVTEAGAPQPGGTGPIRIDFTVPEAALQAAGRADWKQLIQPLQNTPIYNLVINFFGP